MGFRDKHEKIQEKIFEMKDKTAAILQEQEHDLLRAFRARMYDVTMQLEKERNQKDDGALEWIDKARALGKELDVYKMEAVRLDKENQRYQDIIKRLKRLLEIERRNLRQVRTAHVAE